MEVKTSVYYANTCLEIKTYPSTLKMDTAIQEVTGRNSVINEVSGNTSARLYQKACTAVNASTKCSSYIFSKTCKMESRIASAP